MKSPDLINEVIDTNRALNRGPPKLRSASQAHQSKPNEEAEHEAEN